MVGLLNEINTPDGLIVIQSCDSHVANIGIFTPLKIAYRHVSIPELTRCEWQPQRPFELHMVEFDRIIHSYKHRILEVIERLA